MIAAIITVAFVCFWMGFGCCAVLAASKDADEHEQGFYEGSHHV